MINLYKVVNKRIYIESALNKLGDLSDERIQTLVERVGECTKDTEFPLYPFYERVVEKDSSITVSVKEFERKDGSTLLSLVVSRFLSHMHEEISRILNSNEDPVTICELLRLIENDSKEQETDKLLANFDSNFSFLLGIDVFKEVYTEFRKDYIRLLEQGLRISYSEENLRRELENRTTLSFPKTGTSRHYRSKGLYFLSKNKPTRK